MQEVFDARTGCTWLANEADRYMGNDQVNQLRSELYLTLAEALAPGEPPEWLALPGRAWPLYECASSLAASSGFAQRAIQAIAQIPSEPLTGRKARYTALFCGKGAPAFWLYESVHQSGRLCGPETRAVEAWYRAAGVELNGAELPDHASSELAFLAHLASLDPDSRTLERRFIAQHAGRWLPDLGRGLACTQDQVYGPIGELLTGWLEEAIRPNKKTFSPSRPGGSLPFIQVAEKCSLCGFCAQVCPTRALSIQENHSETLLILSPASCISCGKCERVCEFQAMKILSPMEFSAQPIQSLHDFGSRLVLRRSPLATCRACGAPIASQAEMSHINIQLGFPAWLDYCLACRV